MNGDVGDSSSSFSSIFGPLILNPSGGAQLPVLPLKPDLPDNGFDPLLPEFNFKFDASANGFSGTTTC